MNASNGDTKNTKKTGKNHLKTVMVVERDIVRKLIIPGDKNRKLTTLLPESQFDRIKKNSRLLADHQDPSEQTTPTQMILQETENIAALQREIEQLKTEEITELEEEQRRKKQHILARMEEMKREEEDEMKQCNSLILNIKCKAIQDAQVAEKEFIKQQLKSHERAEDAKIEEDRKKALEIIKKKREEEWVKKQQYAQSILEQMQLNEEKKLKQIQLIQKEYKLMNLKAERMKQEEKQNSQEKAYLYLELKKQNEKLNEEIKLNKEVRKEKEKMESLKVQEYLKNKIQQEKDLEFRNKLKKQLQERELARLWTLQKTSQTLSQLKDEIMAQRAQEQTQRKWREKEIEMIKKKLHETEELREIRQRQISEKMKHQAMEIYEKKEQAEKINNDSWKLKEELEMSKSKQKEVIERHKEALKKQIAEKEQKRIRQREEILKEGEDLRKRMQKRDKIIKECIRHKIENIKYMKFNEELYFEKNIKQNVNN